MSERAGRSYHFAPPDRTGAIFGLSRNVVATLGTGITLGVLALSRGATVAGLAVVAASAGLAFARADGGPLVEALPARLRWFRLRLAGKQRWLAPLPLVAGARRPWPAALDGQVVMAVDPDAHGLAGPAPVAVVHDRLAGTVAATLMIAGRQFALVDRPDQDARLARWGDALAAFVRERTPVVSVRWSEWAAPAGIEDHLAFIDGHAHGDADSEPLASYRQLVADAGPLATRHEVLATVTVAVGRARGSASDRLGAAVAALCSELRLFAARLDTAGLAVSAPLSPGELARACRARLDPSALAVLDRTSASLGELAGLVGQLDSGPLACESQWAWWRADGSIHRGFYVADWPRLDQPADWLGGLLVWAGAVRSFTLVAEPVSPRLSRQAILRQATKLDSDREHRERSGFRVGALHRRAAEAVETREEELVAGFPELTYAGVVTVCAANLEDLDRRCDDLVQTAAGFGVELRALHGRHDQAVAATLPLARALAPPRRAG